MPIRLIDIDESIPVTFDTPIALVRSDERYPLTVYGTQVTYRRLSVAEALRILERSQRSRNGRATERTQNDLELQYAVLDWQGVEDPQGQPVACAIPLTDRFLQALPNTAKTAFAGPLGALWPEGQPWEGPPATLTIRRILSHELDTIRAEQTVRGLLHGLALWRAAVALCLKGWEHVYDQGQPVPVSEEARDRLPLAVLLRAFNAIVAAEMAQQEALANLP